jgi:large subunit ribosomal protein L13
MTTRTYRLSGKRIQRNWHVIDAGGRPLGRVATEAARLLLGKHKPEYEPHLAMGDHVVVINAKRIALTGNKSQQKVYYRHTGYPGGLRTRTFEQQMARDPRRVVETAVKGMLPHNSLGRELFRHLKVYSGPDHPHEAQLNAGTGERARKRAAEAERETVAKREAKPKAAPEAEAKTGPQAAPAAAAAEERELRLSGSLTRHKREELDAEAQRLGIEIEQGWKKDDVAAAIKAHYDRHPVEDEE